MKLHRVLIEMAKVSTSSANYVFIMIFLILALLYFIVFVFTIHRVRKIYQKNTTLIVSKMFFFCCALLCAFRVLSSGLLIIESYKYDYTNKDVDGSSKETNLAKLLYNGLYISGVVFGMMFFSLFWYIIVFTYKSHIRVGNVLENTKNPAASVKGLNVYYLILLIYTIIHISYIGLYNIGFYLSLVTSQFYISGICINNILAIVYYITGVVILKFKFSGVPYKTNVLSKQNKHLQKLGYFWVNIFTSQLYITCD